MERFSKKTLTVYIQEKLNAIQKDWGFNPRCGTAQVLPIAANRLTTNPIDRDEVIVCANGDELQYTRDQAYQAYAEFQTLLLMADNFELNIVEVPPDFKQVTIPGYPGKTSRFRPENA